MVAGRKPFKPGAPRLPPLLDNADLADYDLRRPKPPSLATEFRPAGIDSAVAGRAVVDVDQFFQRLGPRGLARAVRRHRGRDHYAARSAAADAKAAVLDAKVAAHGAAGDGRLDTRRGRRRRVPPRRPVGLSSPPASASGGRSVRWRGSTPATGDGS